MRERIIVQPNIHFGKPCIAGTRITVESVLELVHEGIAPAVICRDYYPNLSVEDIRACTQLSAEQRAELARRDAELDANPGIALTWEQIRASIEAKP